MVELNIIPKVWAIIPGQGVAMRTLRVIAGGITLCLLLCMSCKKAGKVTAPMPTLFTVSNVQKIPTTTAIFGSNFSPDGSKIAFTGRVPNGPNFDVDIWIINSDGTEEKQLTYLTRAHSPSWFPTGDKILFELNGDFYSVDTTGKVDTIFITSEFESNGTVSADGQLIAYTSSEIGGTPNVFTFHISSTSKKRISDTTEWAAFSTWSRVGDKIFYHAISEGCDNIWSMDSTGGSKQNLTKSSGCGGGGRCTIPPRETPDGNWVTFGCNDCWIVKTDGSTKGPFLQNASYVSFSPSGKVSFTRNNSELYIADYSEN